MNAAQLQAKQEEDFEEWFERARNGFHLWPNFWPRVTDQLFNEINEHELYRLINANWHDEAEIGRLCKQHFREAFERVWNENK